MRFERIGSYDVTALIGEGGMGQVYQATDTKLNRQVALKILPEAFASDPDRLARFQREAQVLASLNHPNIAAIHGLEDREGTKALVLELVEGPTLADRIAQGAIPLDEALPIAKQIAEALEAAHEAGVIHRDLKPANIKVRDDGTVKVLDFGLAKALDTTPEGDPSQSPTLTAAATQMGVIMGTAAYMSPEQASGATADKRSDIWSFGVVLFEMLTGQRLFTGKTVAHVMAKVLDRDLDLTVLPTTTPAPIKRLLRRCLEREQKRRLRDVGEALSHLEEAATTPVEEPSVAASVTPVAQTAGWRQALPLALGLAVVAAVITGVAVWSVTRPEPPQLVRLTVALNEGPPFIGLESRDVAMSPDGEYIAYLTGGKWPQVLPDEQLLYTSCCPTQVWVVDLATGEQTSLLENAFFGRYSQTGHIIFARSDSLLAAPFDQDRREVGTPSPILDEVVTGHEWHAEYAFSDSGTLVYLSGVSAFDRTLVRIGRDGAASPLSLEERFHSHPVSFAPDGDRLALTLYHGLTVQQDIFLFDLVRGDYDPLTTDPHNDFHPHFSPDGQQIAFTSRRGGGADLYVVPSDKSRPAELLYANEYAKWTDSWLPDGTLLAFHQEHPETGWDVWTYAIGESEARPLLTERFNEGESAFSPDGLWIAYQSDEGGQNEVYVASFPGLGRRCKVSVDGGEKPQWASDGTELFFSKPLYGTQVAAMVVDVSNRDFCDSDPQPLFDGMDHYQWNVSPTGDFFVTVAPRDPPRLNLVLNWFEELTRLVPTGR